MLLREHKRGQPVEVLAESDDNLVGWNHNVTTPLVLVNIFGGDQSHEGKAFEVVGTPEEMEKLANNIINAVRVYRQYS